MTAMTTATTSVTVRARARARARGGVLGRRRPEREAGPAPADTMPTGTGTGTGTGVPNAQVPTAEVPKTEVPTAEVPRAEVPILEGVPLQVNALQAMCRQVFGFRLAMIAVAAPAALLNAAPGLGTRLVGAAVVVTFMGSYVLFRDWERFGPLLLRHPRCWPWTPCSAPCC